MPGGNGRKPAVLVAVAYLADKLDVPVFDTVPRQHRPDAFVRVTRAGGVRSNLVSDSALLVFECWDKTSAESLAVRTADLVEAAPGECIAYTDDSGTEGAAWINAYNEVGGPAQHLDAKITDMDRWVFSAEWAIATNT